MPNNVTDSARDEEKWEKAEGIAKKQLGHAPKSDKDWAYVMGIYKKMKPDHQFKSDKSASDVVEKWMARRVVANFEELMKQQMFQDFYRSVERKLILRPKEVNFSAKHIYMRFKERFSGGWYIDFEANVLSPDGRRVWVELEGDRRKYTTPAQAAKAINERRELEIEMNDPNRD